MSEQDNGDGRGGSSGGFGDSSFGSSPTAGDAVMHLGQEIGLVTTGLLTVAVRRVKALMVAAKAPPGDRAALRVTVTMTIGLCYRVLRASGLGAAQTRTMFDDACNGMEAEVTANGCDPSAVALATMLASGSLEATEPAKQENVVTDMSTAGKVVN